MKSWLQFSQMCQSLIVICVTAFLLMVPSLLRSQTVILPPQSKTYTNTKSRTFDPYIRTTTCPSVNFSVTYNFSVPWSGSGNMEASSECPGCSGDPDDPEGTGCADCWDFLWVRFLVNGEEVGGQLIGAGTNSQSGTISANNIVVPSGAQVAIEIYTQTWASNESVSFTARITGNTGPVMLEPMGPYCATQGLVGLPGNPGGVPGTWSGRGVSGTNFNPATAGPGTHTLTFTPSTGQCATRGTVDVEVLAAGPADLESLEPICQNTGNILLPTTTPNGIEGNWSGTGVSNNRLSTTNAGTRRLTFTPLNGQCARANTLDVNITAPVTPTFTDLGPYCQGQPNVQLPDQDDNGIGGAWSGTGVSGFTLNTNVGGTGPRTLRFTPSPGQCASPSNYIVQIDPKRSLTISGIGPFCTSTTPVALATTQNGETGTWSGTGVSANRLNIATAGVKSITFTPTNTCFNPTPVNVNVGAVDLNPIANQNICGNSFTLPAITSASPLNGSQAYFTGSNGTGTRYSPGSQITGNQTLFTYYSDAGCTDQDTFTITFLAGPVITPQRDTTVCGSFTLPPIRGTGLSTNVAYFTASQGGGTRLSPGQVLTTSQRLFIYEGTPTCFVQDTFQLTIASRPQIDSIPDVQACENYVLPTIRGTGLSPNAAYFTGPNGTGTRYLAGQNIAGDLRLYAFDPIVGCTAERSFVLDTLSRPQLVLIRDTSTCGSFQLPAIQGRNLSSAAAYFTGSNGTGTRLVPGQTLTSSDTLFIFDQKSTCAVQQPFAITIAQGPQLNLRIRDSINCNGGSTGSIALQVTNGIAPIRYRWNPSSLDGIEDPTNLRAGTYVVTVTDASNCAVSASIVLTEPTPLSLNCTVSRPVSRVGGEDGAASISLAGGSPVYRLQLIGPVSQTLSNLPAGPLALNGLRAGAYRLLVTDSRGCTDSCQLIMSQPGCDLAVIAQANPPSCAGTATGSIDVQVIDGTAPLTITWNNTALNGSFSPRNLRAGTYHFLLLDQVGCTARDTLILLDPTAPSIACTLLNPVSRVGGTNGVVQISAQGGSAPYRLSWTGNRSGNVPLSAAKDTSISGLSAGTYPFILQDNQGCADTCSATVTEPVCALEANIQVLQVIRCSGQRDGVLGLQVRNTQAPWSVVWTLPNGTTSNRDTLRNVAAGNYRLRVTDTLGCVDTVSLNLSAPAPLQLDCRTLADVSTVGGQDGRAVLRFTGGTGPIALDWGGVQPGMVLASSRDSLLLGNLPAGTYQPNTIDANGCRETCQFRINAPVCTLSGRLTTLNPACQGASNGFIAVRVNGGRAPFAFAWSNNGPNNDTLTNLAAGRYQVTLTDASNCQVILDTVLLDPSALELNCQTLQNVRTINGRDGIARLNINGGTAPYTLVIQGPVPSTRTVSRSLDVGGLSVGSYMVMVRDLQGCQQTCSIQISEPSCNLSLRLQAVAPLCNGAATGQITVTTNGGKAPFRYDWSVDQADGQAVARNLRAGRYTVVVSDSVGCVGVDSLVLSEPSALSITCGNPVRTTTVGGRDGRIGLRFSGGTRPYTLRLSGARQDSFVNIQVDSFRVNGLAKGTYRLTLTDANNCSIPGCSFTIEDPTCDLNVQLSGVDNACAGQSNGRITASVMGAQGTVTYDWSDNRFDGQNTAQNLRSGPYQLFVTDARLCRDTATYQVAEPAALQLNCVLDAAVTTLGGTEGRIRTTARGGTAPQTVTLNGPSTGRMSNPGNGVFVFDSLRAGTYTLVASDINGCRDTCTQVLEPIQCTLQGTAQATPPSCTGDRNGSINIEVSGNRGAVSFLWEGMVASGQNPRALPSGTYRVTLTDAARCSANLSITLSNPVALSLIATAQNQPTPANPMGGTAVVTYAGGRPQYTLQYYPEPFSPEGRMFLAVPNAGTSTLTNLRAGNYTVILSDRNGCRDTTTLILSEPLCQLSVAITSARADCESSHLSTLVRGGTLPVQYNWTDNRINGQANPRNVVPGTYRLRVVDANGCVAVDSITLALDPQALQVRANVLQPRCPGELGVIALRSIGGGQGPFTLSLNAGAPQRFNNPPFSSRNLNAGTYQVQVSNAAGCRFDTTLNVLAPRMLSLELGADTTLKKGTRYTFKPRVNFSPAQITWSPTEGLNGTNGLNAQVEPKFTTSYALQLRDSAGCVVTDRILIVVSGQVEAYFPSAFSPNGDNINDTFTAFANADIERIEVLRIYERWGGMVYEGKDLPPNDLTRGWDGTNRGQLATPGVYVYHGVVRLRDGSTYQASGEVILVR